MGHFLVRLTAGEMARFCCCCSFTKGLGEIPWTLWSFLLAEALLCENKSGISSQKGCCPVPPWAIISLCNHNTAFFDKTLGHDFSRYFWDKKSNGLDGSAGSNFSGGWEGTAVPPLCLTEGLPKQLKNWHDLCQDHDHSGRATGESFCPCRLSQAPVFSVWF